MVRIKLLDGSGEVDLNHLVEDVDRHGNVRVYFRRAGRKKIRLRSPIGSEAFIAEYRSAFRGEVRAATANGRTKAPSLTSFRWLVERYYSTASFKTLEARTQHVRRLILDPICMIEGDKPFADMEPRHVRERRDEKADRPEAANAVLKALRQVFRLAVEDGLMERNPAKEVPYIRVASDGFHTWTVQEVERFEARHPVGSKARLALALLMYTGVRRGDLVRLGRQMVRDGWLTFTEAKGQKRIVKVRELPVLPELKQVIDSTPIGNLTFLVTQVGAPFTSNGFGNWFDRRCKEADVPGRAHGLRKAGATIAVNNGASEQQLMAIFGWTTSRQALLYTKKANRKKLAGDAMHLLVTDQKANKSVPLSPVVRSGGTKLDSK